LDIVALLSVFRHESMVGAALGRGTARIRPAELKVESLRRSALLGLAEQMGREMTEVRGNALRSPRGDPGRVIGASYLFAVTVP